MSVINETLKALELRGGRGALPGSFPSPGRTEAHPRPAPSRLALWLLPPLLAAALWAWWPILDPVISRAVEAGLEKETVKDTANDSAKDTVPDAVAAAATGPEPAAATQTQSASGSQPEPESPGATNPGRADDVVASPGTGRIRAATAPAEAAQEDEPEVTRNAEPAVAQPATLAIQASPLSDAERAAQLWAQAQSDADPEPLLVEALALDPRLHPARLELLERQGERFSVEDRLMAAARAYPEEAGYPLLAAQQALARGDNAVAAQWLAWATRLTPDPAGLAKRASLARQLGQWELARQDYLALLQLEPRRGAWWLGLALVRDQIGDHPGALSAYRQALESPQLSAAARTYAQERVNELERR